MAQNDKGGAGYGLVFGYQIALKHLGHLVEAAMIDSNPLILLRLYALGLITDPVQHCIERGTWDDSLGELAAELGCKSVQTETDE